ncbi:MAG: SDR family oxidoreductase [Pseudomonadota bacterium]|jgi:dTDP-4-dehydrorhamnose reductase
MSARILLTGAHGQLGWELQRTCPAHVELHAFDRAKLDITQAEQVHEAAQAIQPHWIINAAAYTAVDKAESEPKLAYAVNRDGAHLLAEAARAVGARMVQISTDFVFDGQQSHPYPPSPLGGALDGRTPQGLPARKPEGSERRDQGPGERGAIPTVCTYGASKQAGELAVLEVLGVDALIVRTAWVYSSHGHNFVKTMLRLMRERESLGVVADQIGSPTWAKGLAQALWRAIEKEITGIHHWTDAGVASWYDFACAIQDEAVALGLLDRPIPIRPIRTEEYPTPARRPAYSVLDKTTTWKALGIDTPSHWRHPLRHMLRELRPEGAHG